MAKPLFVTGNSADFRLVAALGSIIGQLQPTKILVDLEGPFALDSFEGMETEESSVDTLHLEDSDEGLPDAVVLLEESGNPYGRKAVTKLRKVSPMVRVVVPGVMSETQTDPDRIDERVYIKGEKKYEGSFLLEEAEWQSVLAKSTKKRRVHQEELFEGDMTLTKKVKKPKKERPPKDLRTVFRQHLATVTEDGIKKPWMAQKSFRLMKDPTELRQWCAAILADKSRHVPVYGVEHDETLPVIAVDTETIGLDTRILVHMEECKDYDPPVWIPTYEVKIEMAGICLSPDGIEGIYIPINHDDGNNMNREECSAILQDFFNKSHLVFYNAKFDREVLKLTMGINMRGYPYFEDVQVLQYINDPKADLGDKKKGQFTGDAGGLKALSESILGIEQVKMDAIGKVKAEFYSAEKFKLLRNLNPDWDEEKCKKKATSQRIQYVPFTWIPTNLALWYAAGDAICTWLLWEKAKEEARARKLVHHIDHELVDTLAWVERQRYIVADDKLIRTINWHQNTLKVKRGELRVLALEAGWQEPTTDEGKVIEPFNVDSNDQIRKLLYEIKKLDIVKKTDTGNASTDADAMLDLKKKYPKDPFLTAYGDYKDYVSLHPENLRFDPLDKSARVYLKQCVVAGGRLAASGGDFEIDGGFGLNIQGIKRVEGNWWVRGNVLVPDAVPEDQIEEFEEKDLHKSCIKDGKKAPGIVKNHIGHYLGYAICLVPKCTTCATKHGILIPKTRMDANEVINMRSLFVAPKGWTFFTTDYSNIEMRCAANVSREPEFIREFLEGKGDFHSLTASKVFPAFNDPNTDKAIKKALRSLAKIINFALLYGGTEYTIFENMKKQKPDITWDECKEMVAKYWAGVPQFRLWCDGQQNTAKTEMYCQTATGRIIKFESAMEALHIHRPTGAEMDQMWEYRALNRQAEQLKAMGNKDQSATLKAQADRLWRDPDTGVRNALDFQRYMGKIQRVAVNVPLQGLAGDFMRIALNRIRIWASQKDPLVQSVLRCHGSVHDEIDYAVKNEYAPFVIPRVTRLMKLRKYHTQRNWTVPIECDTEYAQSWDVEHHLTGDDDHKPSGWTEMTGMENYLPADFDMATVDMLVAAIVSGDQKKFDKAKAWLDANLHIRANAVVCYALYENPSKKTPAPDAAYCKKHLIAALQLHEYWTVDGTPDSDDATMETLEQYEVRCGLTPADRGYMPEMGFLGAVPLDKVRRPKLEVLGEALAPEDVQIMVGASTITASVPATPELAEIASIRNELENEIMDLNAREEAAIAAVVETAPEQLSLQPAVAATAVVETAIATAVLEEDEDPFLAAPMTVKKPAAIPLVEATATAVAVAVEVPVVDPLAGIQELRHLSGTEVKRLKELLGFGTNTIQIRIREDVRVIRNVAITSIPKEFLK